MRPNPIATQASPSPRLLSLSGGAEYAQAVNRPARPEGDRPARRSRGEPQSRRNDDPEQRGAEDPRLAQRENAILDEATAAGVRKHAFRVDRIGTDQRI